MIVKVRELDSFMDRMSNRSCFSETLVELKIEETIRKIVIILIFLLTFSKSCCICLYMLPALSPTLPQSVYYCISLQGFL